MKFVILAVLLAILIAFIVMVVKSAKNWRWYHITSAVITMLLALVFLFPTARVLTVFPIVFYPVFLVLPAIVFLGLWFALQFWNGAMSFGTSNTSPA